MSQGRVMNGEPGLSQPGFHSSSAPVVECPHALRRPHEAALQIGQVKLTFSFELGEISNLPGSGLNRNAVKVHSLIRAPAVELDPIGGIQIVLQEEGVAQ